MKKEITHERLVKAAGAWLGRKCRVVATELTTIASETPDAIGWNGYGFCVVVECKASKADFRANAKKSHERQGWGVGDERWFMTPPDLVEDSEVPDGWGLLEFTPSRHAGGYFIRQRVKAPRRDKRGGQHAANEEKLMLISIAGRALEACSRLKSLWLGEEETVERN